MRGRVGFIEWHVSVSRGALGRIKGEGADRRLLWWRAWLGVASEGTERGIGSGQEEASVAGK